MEKIDKIIQIVRENMVANAPGTQGGFSASSDSKGPVSGFDPMINFIQKRKKKYATGGINSRKLWLQYLKGK